MTLVADASAIAAALVDDGPDGAWARDGLERASLTAYDAAYVALAEELDAPLVTLDRRLSRSHGPACEFLLP